jgi:O-antigen/teichoic acid export membrane protein
MRVDIKKGKDARISYHADRSQRATGHGSSREMRRPLMTSFSVSLAIQGVNVVTGILLARTLGLHDRGALAAVILWPSLLATVGSLGVPDAVTYYAARAGTSRKTLLGTSIAIASIESVAMVLIGLLLIPLVLGHLGPGTVQLTLVFLAFVPLNLLTLALMGFLNGLQHFTAFNALRAMVILIAAAAIVVLAAVGSLTPGTAAIAYLGANAATLLATVLIVARIGELRLAVSGRTAKDLLSFGLKSQTSSVSSMLNERLDQLVISAVLAPAKLGLYVVAVTLTSLVNLIGSSVALVALPVVARLRSTAEQLAPARRLIVLTLGLSTLVAVPMIVFAPRLLELFFGQSFRAAADPTRILLAAAVLMATSRALGAILKALGRPLQAGLADAIALGVTVIALAALLPLFGLLGAAVASLLAYGVSLAWMIDRAARALAVRPWRLFLPEGSVRRAVPAAVGGDAGGRASP